MIKGSTFRVDLTILIQQTAPLNRCAETRQAQALEHLDIGFITMVKIVADIRANLIIKISNALVRPSIPNVFQFAVQFVCAFRLRTRERCTEEEVLWQSAHFYRPFCYLF